MPDRMRPTGSDSVARSDGGTGRFLSRQEATGTYAQVVGIAGVDTTGAIEATSTITAALAAGSGKTVFIPPGTYLIDTLDVPANTTLWLDDRAILKLKAGNSRAAVRLSGQYATLRGGFVDGNTAGQVAVPGASLVDVRGADATVERVTITNAKDYGVRSFADRSRILNCRVFATGDNGIYIQPTASGPSIVGGEIAGCLVDRTDQSAGTVVEGGIKVHNNGSYTVTQVRIRGNRVLLPPNPTLAPPVCIEVFINCDYTTVSDNITSGGTIGISMAGCKHSTVTGNTIYNAKSLGIEFSAASYCTANGNSIDGNSVTVTGINCNTSTNHITITGNTVRRCSGSHIKVQQTATHTSISSNVIDCTTATYGIEVTGSASSYTTITGNTVDGNGTGLKAVMLDTSDRVTVTGNTFRRFTQNGILIYAISAVTLNFIVASGNNFESTNGALATQLSGGAAIGSNVKAVGGTGLADVFDLSANVRIITSTGSPEGVQAAGIGSIYLRSNGGAATTLYVKESGTSNTGWIAK